MFSRVSSEHRRGVRAMCWLFLLLLLLLLLLLSGIDAVLWR
jgi:hypothetical protein